MSTEPTTEETPIPELPQDGTIRFLLQHPQMNTELVQPDETVEQLALSGGGSAVVVRKQISKLPYHYLKVTFGPVLPSYDAQSVAAALEELKQFAKTDGAVWIDVHPMTFSLQQAPLKEVFTKAGFSEADHQVYKATVLVDLSKTEEELFADFQRRGQKAYRQSITRGITIEQVELNEANFDTFYKLYQQTTDRSGYIIEDEAWLKKLVLELGADGRMILFFAMADEQPVGALLCYNNGASMSTVFQGNDYDPEIMNKRPANALYWDAMKWAKANGFRWFDFGGITYTEEMTSDKKGGIFNFKLQFGGFIAFLPGNYRYVAKKVPYKMVQAALPVYSKIALARAKKGS